jgi:transglycosylase-like protein with SLT domain
MQIIHFRYLQFPPTGLIDRLFSLLRSGGATGQDRQPVGTCAIHRSRIHQDRNPMQIRRSVCAVASVVAIMALVIAPPVALAGEEDHADESFALSPYWTYVVQRWEPIIRQEADRRRVDADLIAAVIWQESRGSATARGPAGAVGLMMVMPFEWRPEAEKLENPWTNLFWGSRALATTVRDGRGDLFYSLAAYNGSWEKIDRSSTQRYAAKVLDYYARAVAVRRGLSADAGWIAVIAPEGMPGPRTITVLGPDVPLTRYTERPCGSTDIPQVPDDVPPTATAISFVDDRGAEVRVNMWLITDDRSTVVESTAAEPLTLAVLSSGIPSFVSH